MSSNVRELLERIKHLPESEQIELRAELAKQDEEEWLQLTLEARKIAKQRGLDDDAIARIVESQRYGNNDPR